MNLVNVETYIAAHVAPLEEAVRAEFVRFLDFVKGEEIKIREEIAHLEARGYVVRPLHKDPP